MLCSWLIKIPECLPSSKYEVNLISLLSSPPLSSSAPSFFPLSFIFLFHPHVIIKFPDTDISFRIIIEFQLSMESDFIKGKCATNAVAKNRVTLIKEWKRNAGERTVVPQLPRLSPSINFTFKIHPMMQRNDSEGASQRHWLEANDGKCISALSDLTTSRTIYMASLLAQHTHSLVVCVSGGQRGVEEKLRILWQKLKKLWGFWHLTISFCSTL